MKLKDIQIGTWAVLLATVNMWVGHGAWWARLITTASAVVVVAVEIARYRQRRAEPAA